MHEDFVKIMRCRFCGGHTNALALHKRLKSIKGDVYDTEPCDKCKEHFKIHKFFIGNCGHSGFIKTEALKKVLNPEAFAKLENHKIFRIEQCFACMGYVKLDECPTL